MAPKTSFKSAWTQFFPPKAIFTDKDVPNDLSGKIYVVTGANCGLGKELSQVLYSKNANVYLACRSEEKGNKAIEDIKKNIPKSKGKLVLLALDLGDLNKVKTAAEAFLSQETKLHVLFNNAGTMATSHQPPLKTVQGYEQALGVNCVGTFLFTKLLTPTVINTANDEPANTVRIVWLSSFGLGLYAPENRGIDMNNLDYHIPMPHMDRYGISKCGDWLLAVEYARRYQADGIMSVPINPGNLRTLLARDQPWILRFLVTGICYPIINGVYTQLFAAFSPEIAAVDWSEDWGKLTPLKRVDKG